MLLAIDTATRMISLAVHDGTRLIAESSWETANYHTVELAPAVRAMLARASVEIPHLRAVAVALGPGSFTGLRIGLGLAKGLATARDMRLIGVPTLDILASGQPRRRERLVAVLEAGRGRICAQQFCWREDAWTPQDEPAITTWDALLDGIDQEALVSGEIDAEGAHRLQAAITAGKPLTVAPAAERLRRAGYLAELAWARLRRGQSDDPYTLVPVYLHQPGIPHP
jgi:tRNA threonylcarbamoyladenosine biosynthesis protein TsaB